MGNTKNSDNSSETEDNTSKGTKVVVKPADLRQLMKESVDAPTHVQHPTEEEWAEIDARRQNAAQTLADRMYELTNIERETDLTVYLETINSVVLDTASAENQVVLQTMRDYFVQTYGEDIRRLGHSPLLEDQIVHRTGRDTREIVETTLRGFDVKRLANQVRARAVDFSEEAPKMAARVMYDLTHRQVGELREYYATLPGQEIAAVLHAALLRLDLRARPFPDGDTIKYILLYRDATEIAQIECQYNEIYHFDRASKHELCFREQIQEVFPEEEAAELLGLLEGFQPGHFADLIYDRITHYVSEAEWLHPMDDLHNDFAGPFRRNRPETQLWQKELAARCAIETIVGDLTPEQFAEVRESLKQRYDIELTEALFPCNNPFKPRSVALDLYKSCLNVEPRSQFRRAEQYLTDRELMDVKDEYRLSKNNELSDIIQARAEEKKAGEALGKTAMALLPLAYLTPDQLREVRIEFLSVIGTPMNDFVIETVSHISHGEIPRYVEDFLNVILTGVGRQPLHADIFQLFANKTKRAIAKQRETQKQSLLSKIPALVSAVEKTQVDENAADLLRLLKNHSLKELHLLEELYTEANEEKVPFLKGIENSIKEEVMIDMKLLFEGIDREALITQIHQNPETAIQYLRLDPDYVARICDTFKETFDIDLYDYIRSRYSARDNQTQASRASILLFALAPEAKKIRNVIKCCEDSAFQDKELLPIFLHYKDDAQTLEACFNLYYADFGYSYEKDTFALLRSLRRLASTEKVCRETMSKSILILEHVQSHVTSELHDMLKDRALGPDTLESVHELLRMHYKDVKTIKRSFNALDPDFTLRETLYQLQLTLDEINKTILIVDGYDPDAAAQQVHSLIEQHEGAALGDALCSLLAMKTTNTQQGVIPSDANWTSEMYHQIRCCYELQFGRSIVSALVAKKVPLKGKGINAITYMLYGSISKIAVDIFTSLQSSDASTAAIVSKLLRKEGPRLRSRIVAMYDAYFVSLGKSDSLQASIAARFGHQAAGHEIIELIEKAKDVLTQKENIETDETLDEEHDEEASKIDPDQNADPAEEQDAA